MGMVTALGLGAVYDFKDYGSAKMEKAQQRLRLFKTEAEGISKSAKLVESGMSNIVKSLGPLAAGAALTGWPVIFAKKAGELQEALFNVGQVSRASAEDMELLKRKAEKIGSTTTYSAQAAAQGMYELASAGMDTAQVLATVDNVQKLAFVSGESFGSMADVTTTAMRAFNLTANDTARITNNIIRLQQVSKFHYNEMGGAIGQVAGAAASANQDLETTLTMLGVLRNTGLSAEMSAFKLRMTLSKLAEPRTLSFFNSLGVSVQGSNGKFRNMIDIFQDLSAALNKRTYQGKLLTDVQKQEILGQMLGVRAADILVKFQQASYTSVVNGLSTTYHGFAAVRKELEEQRHSEGLTDKYATDKMKLLNSQYALSKNLLGELGVSIGDRAMPIVSQWLVVINKNLIAMTTWVKEHPKAVDAIIRLTGAVGKLLLVFGSLRLAMGVLQVMTGGLGLGIGKAAGEFMTLRKAGWDTIPALKGVLEQSTALKVGLAGLAVVLAGAVIKAFWNWRQEINKTNKALKDAQENEERLAQLRNKRLGVSIKSPIASTALGAGRLAVEMGIRTGQITNAQQAAEVYKSAINKSIESGAKVASGSYTWVQKATMGAAAVATPFTLGTSVIGANKSIELQQQHRANALAAEARKELTPEVLQAGLTAVPLDQGLGLETAKRQARANAQAEREAAAASKTTMERAKEESAKRYVGPPAPPVVVQIKLDSKVIAEALAKQSADGKQRVGDAPRASQRPLSDGYFVAEPASPTR